MSLRAIAIPACALVMSCSLLLDVPEATQCSTQRDCDSKPALQGRICSEGFCVARAKDLPPVSNDAGNGCVSTDLCTQINSGRISVCKTQGGACTPWQTEQCKWVSGSIRDPQAVVIGTILPMTAKQVGGPLREIPYSERIKNAIDLSVADFEKALPGGALARDGKQRPFAVVHCDSQYTASGANAAFKHLTEVVGVQALIVGSDDDMASIAAPATLSKVAIACSDCVGNLPSGPLVWRIGPRLALEAPMLARRVQDIEAQIMAAPMAPPEIKVAVLQAAGLGPEALYDALAKSLRFNGKSILENGLNFRAIKTDNPLETSVNHDKFAQQVVEFQPDILIVAMADDFPHFYLSLIENKWPTGARKPHYLTTSLNNTVTSFGAALTNDDDLRPRVTGTRPLLTAAFQANINDFVARYLPENNFVQPDGNWSGFEAGYAMAYAILASRSQPVLDGPHISAGFERLRGGATIVDLRPDSIPVATGLLANPSAEIDIRGLWSDLDWDVERRDFDSNVGTYCFVRDASSNLKINPSAGLSLDTKTGEFSGSFACE